MAQANSSSKLVGRVGMLLAFVGILVFFSGVLTLTPRTFVFVGIAIIALAFVTFFVEEFGLRR